MKSKVSIFFIALCAPVLMWAQASGIPQNVLDQFAADYPDAMEVEWEKDGANFEVDFVANGDQMEVKYDKQAQVVEKEQEIEGRAVPDEVMDAFEVDHPGAEPAEIARVERGGLVYYEVEFMENGKKVEVLYDESGKKLGGDEEDGEEDED